jgi:hypothetical protein
MAPLYLRSTVHHSAAVPRTDAGGVGHEHDGLVETRNEDTAEETPPPGWVLSTPTRHHEVWTLPVLVMLLAVLLVLAAARFGEPLGAVVCAGSGTVVAAGAIALAAAGRSAYAEQTMTASWRLHVVRMTVGVTTAAILAIGSLVVGLPFGVLFGAVGWIPMTFRFARSVPRVDRLLVAWASVFVAVACTGLSVVGFTAPAVPDRLAAVWIGPGSLFAALAVVMAVVQFAVAERTAGAPPLSAPDRTAS